MKTVIKKNSMENQNIRVHMLNGECETDAFDKYIHSVMFFLLLFIPWLNMKCSY